MRRSLALSVCVALAGCHCGQSGVIYTGPHAIVTPGPGADLTRLLEFGKVRVASKVTLPITVQNDGSKDLTVKPSTDPATDPSLRGVFTAGATLTVAAGGTLNLPVEYTPGALGEVHGKIVLETNADATPRFEILLHGTGVSSTLQICRVDPGGEACDDALPPGQGLPLDFGQSRPGTKVDRQLVLRAKGDAPIHLARLGLTAASDPAYALTGAPAMPAEVLPGTDLHLTVSYFPTLGGAAPGELEVLSDNAARPRALVELTGQGIAPRLCIARGDLDFGDVAVGATGKKTATLKSCGLEDLVLSALSTTSPFSLDGTPPALPQTLAPGATLAVPLAFKPATTGLQSQPLPTTTNEPHQSAYRLAGNGVRCTLDLSPGTLDFGQVSTAVKASKTFYLRSVGDSDCTVTALRGPTGTPGFTLPAPPTLPLLMPVGLEVPVQVDFLPQSAGGASAQLQVDSNDSTLTTQLVQLKATGIAPPPCQFTAAPTGVQYGSVDVGKTATVNVVITNHGSSDCYVTGGGATGNPASDASFSATMPGGFPPPTVASGASVTIPVKYAPLSSALHLGTLSVKYSDQPVSIGGGATLSVPLQGGTLLPKLCLTPTLLDYGAVQAGSTVIKSFVIQSCGDGTLTVRGIGRTAGTSADFALQALPAMPLVLAKGVSATINVAYQPASAAAAAGRIEVYSNDPLLLTGKVELKGNLGACATQLVCSPSTVSFLGTEVGRTSAQPVTCTNAGGSPVTVTGVTASAGSSGDLTLQAGALPVTLQGGDTLRAEVQYAPSGVGAVIATFTLATGGCGDAKIDVTAIGVPPKFPRCPAATTFTPKVKWAWNGGSVMKDWSNVTMTPVVVNLDDDNGDGRIDENDIPDVVFASCSAASCCVNCLDPKHLENADLSGEAVLRSISGKDASAHWTADAAALHVPAGSQIAVADLDGDGIPEIIAVQHTFRTGTTCPNTPVDSLPMCGKYISGSLIALDHTGKLLWVSEPWTQPATVVENDSSLLVADLDQDGYPEIIFGDTVFDSTGHVKWHMSQTVGNSGHGTFSAAADLDGDGKLELIAGPTAYRSDGTVLWHTAHVDDGITFVMDVDGDGKPEVIVRPATNVLVVLDGATGSIKKTITLPLGKDQGGIDTGACPAGPSAGDFLGNGKMQIALPAGNWFYLLDPNTGAILWQKPIEDYDGQCGASGAAVFSFFGDGKSDVVYHDTQFIYVWRADGTEVYRSPRTSSTLFETPVIADVDNDGHAEILITNEGIGGTNNGLTALGDSADSWPATRRVWSQWNYHVTDANENGTVPRIEKPFWKTSKLWRGNPPLCTRP